MVDHEDEKTQIISDPAALGLDDDNEKTRMIDPSVLAEELVSSRMESKDKGSDNKKEPADKKQQAAPPPPDQDSPPPPPPEAGMEAFDKTREAPWRASGGPPPPPPSEAGMEAFDKTRDAPWRASGEPPPHPSPPGDKQSGKPSRRRDKSDPGLSSGDNAMVPGLKFRPEYENVDLSQKPLHQLKKMLNDAEGRMAMHETQLFQLEEVQGEMIKDKTGNTKSVEEIRKLSEQRDDEREKMRSSLVDVQIVSEALVRAFNQRQARQTGVSVEEFMQRKRKDHELTIMPWYYPKGDLKRIRITSIIGVVLGLLITFYIPTVEVPPKLITKTTIPDRLANIILERKKRPPPPPPPTLKPKKEEKKAETKPEKPKETRIEPPPRPKKPRTAEREKAREKVKNVGLAKQASVLEKLAVTRTKALKNLGATAGLTTGGSRSKRRQKKLITARAGSGSGGIRVRRDERTTGNVGAGLGGVGGGEIQGGISAADFEEAKRRELAGGGGNASGRSDQEIQIAFDKYQARLYRIYQKELRKNPALRGQVVFELIIGPDGTVTDCRVLSSDLGSPSLEAALVKRIKLIKFPPKPGGKSEKIKYPIDFLPS